MPDGRTWVVSESSERKWEVKTAREREVYFRPINASGVATGGWRPGLPPIADAAVLPESLREVLDIFAATIEREKSGKQEEC